MVRPGRTSTFLVHIPYLIKIVSMEQSTEYGMIYLWKLDWKENESSDRLLQQGFVLLFAVDVACETVFKSLFDSHTTVG